MIENMYEVKRVTEIDFDLDTDIADFEISTLKKFLENKKNILILAILNSKVVGVLRAHILDRYDGKGGEMFLNEIDVTENHRQKGVATKLVSKMKDIAQDSNCFETWVVTNRSNIPAVEMYKKNGYSEENPDDVVMVQSL